MSIRNRCLRVLSLALPASLAASGMLDANRVLGSDPEGGPPVEVLAAEIATLVRECVNDYKPIDVSELDRKIESLPPVFEGRDQMIECLGKLLVFNGDIYIEEGADITGRAPLDVLKSGVVRAFARFNDEAALPYLRAAYASGGADKYAGLAETIRALGGSLPPIRKDGADEESPRPVSEAEKKARRAEVRDLATKIKENDLSPAILDRIIKRIGRIGGPQDVRVIVARLESGGVHWVVRQDSLEALGCLGGPDAQAFLIRELMKPMPVGAQLDDYGTNEAILRSQAALALGNCGDDAAAKLLVKTGNDSRQFQRVRESCKRAAARIGERLLREQEK